MSGFWDDESLRPAMGEVMKFDTVGDTVTGTIKSLGKRVFEEGTPRERWVIEVVFNEDDARTVMAGQVLLKQALWEARPDVGDGLTIELVAVSNTAGKTLKKFPVAVTRRTDEVVVSALGSVGGGGVKPPPPISNSTLRRGTSEHYQRLRASPPRPRDVCTR